VNYFSHFLIDYKHELPYYNSALILPDITKKWLKSFNHPLPITNPLHQQLLQGCLQHYKSDKQFHSSAFFDKYFLLINTEFKKEIFSESLNRKWFIAHIALELLIDRVFARYFSEKLDLFYSNLNKIDTQILLEFLTNYGLINPNEFLTFFNHFRSIQYIYYYTDNNRFIYSLSKVMTRVGIKEIGKKDAEKLLTIILHIETNYMNNPTALLNELKAIFTQ